MSNALDRNGSPFVVGARVVSYTHVERFPHFHLPPGVTGVIVEVREEGVDILPDLPWRASVPDDDEMFPGRQIEGCFDAIGLPLASEEWVVISPPSGLWPNLRGPSDAVLRDLAREVLASLLDGWNPSGLEDALLYVVQGAMDQVGDSDILIRDALRGASYDDSTETRERMAAMVVKVAERRLTHLHKSPPPPKPKRWRTSVRVTFEVDVPVTLDADDVETVTRRARGVAGDFADGCSVLSPNGEKIEARITDIGCATAISAVKEGE